ncbi:MAG: hypothetical protein IJX74_07220 [Clostridia bacterium]|nr:hypothetical protein [Clostridia bacterium]
MKRIISVTMICAIMLSIFALVGCEPKAATLKLGLGVYSTASATDATEDKDGQGQATVTVAAVLVDDDGKIVKAFVDCADSKVGYTAEGKAVATTSFKTKYESGNDYGMTNPAYGGTATKEWYEQADAFCTLIVGKTSNEVAALVADNAKGTDEVIKAGCTIYVAEFAKAIEKAIAGATVSNATKNDTLKLGVSTAQTTTDANEDKDGTNKIETTVFAAAVNADGKVVAAVSDCVEVTFTFDTAGASTFNAPETLLSKKQKGDDYGMKNPTYGSAKEWYEHAAAFDAACVGKTANEIEGLMGTDSKGNADLQSAGCTIDVSGFVKAASKIK